MFQLVFNVKEARQRDDMWLKAGNVAETVALYSAILAVGIKCRPRSNSLLVGRSNSCTYRSGTSIVSRSIQSDFFSGMPCSSPSCHPIEAAGAAM